MSASLVGSEMCIRDRRCTAPVARDIRARKSVFWAAGVHTCSWAAFTRNSCLLYTSDAADDM
eukprot:5917549-Alexandrium_andersonii.AAC.1